MPVLRLDLRCLKEAFIYHGQVVLEGTSIEREKTESGLTRQLMKIYNSVDACTPVKSMWERFERLMRGTMQNKVDRETRFNNEFDQFVAGPGEALVSIYNQDTFDDLFDYLQQFEKLVNASRAKKLEKSHDPLAMVAHMGSSSKTPSPYDVTHPSLVVYYDDDYQGDAFQNNSEDPLTSAMIIMSSPDYIYPIIVPSDFDVEDAFSSTNTHDYTPASPDYFPATPRNISPDPLDGLSNVSLSPMFDPQDFFLPEDILPPHKRSCFLSFSSTNPSGPPQVFEIGENYHGVLDTSYARHVKHIETILNHLDEILL
ncbi:hypothetical protein Tco_0973131, partial [Tanacetum coccineum]